MLQNIDSNLFCTFSALKSLSLAGNKLTLLPLLSKCNELHKLNLNNNMIETIPKDFARLSYLKELRLANNKIDKLPDFMASM
jgi:Leucine-rich repeat (LRR) protein